jgi:iron(III) transport system substrate-binding protein
MAGVCISVLSIALLVAACAAPASPAAGPGAVGSAAERAGAATADTPRLTQLYEAARQEGEVIFESAQRAEELKPLIDRFSQKYPGVRVSYVNRTPGETVERIVAEAAAGRVNVDVSASPLGTVLPLIERNLTLALDWKDLAPDLPDEALLLDGRLVTWYHLPSGVAYNTNLVRQDGLPKTWEDLLAPRWQGRKMILDARGVPVFHLPFVWGEERAYDYLAKLKAQDPILVPRLAVASERVVAGEAPLATTTLADIVQFREQGAPVGWVPLPTVMVSVSGLFVVQKAPHPNAAQLWSAFLLSEEGRQLFEEQTYQGPVYRGSNTRVERLMREANVEPWFEDTGEKARQRAEYQRQMERILGGLQ